MGAAVPLPATDKEPAMSQEDDDDWFDDAVPDDDEETTDPPAPDEDLAEWAPEGVSDAEWGVEWTTDPGTDEAADEPFDQDFASAFDAAPAPSGSPEAPEQPAAAPASFSEEPFESEIPRIDIGIEGLDAMIQGGVPERTLMVALGDAGTGKTTFGLHFLQQALKNDENAVFITLEESHDRILETADDKGWDFSAYVDKGQLVILDIDPIEMSNSLTSIRNELPSLIQEFNATRLVLDSVSLLEMMYDNQAMRRNQIYDFTRSLKEAGVTTMLTSEASETNPYHSRFGIIEYLTDAVFVLRYIRPDDHRETRLAIEIQKIRDANHSREMKPFEITDEGISVYRQANIF